MHSLEVLTVQELSLQMAVLCFIGEHNYSALQVSGKQKDPLGQASIKFLTLCTVHFHHTRPFFPFFPGKSGNETTNHSSTGQPLQTGFTFKTVRVLTLVFQLETTVHPPVIYCQCLVDCFHCVGYYQVQPPLSRHLKNKFKRRGVECGEYKY